LNGDFTRWVGDGDLEVLDAADFWVGAGGYQEGVFGSVGVVFFVGYLVCSESWSWGGCQLYIKFRAEE
jgi:hypothetical protein